MTVIAILGENGLNVVFEIDNFGQLGSGGLSEKGYGEKAPHRLGWITLKKGIHPILDRLLHEIQGSQRGVDFKIDHEAVSLGCFQKACKVTEGNEVGRDVLAANSATKAGFGGVFCEEEVGYFVGHTGRGRR